MMVGGDGFIKQHVFGKTLSNSLTLNSLKQSYWN